MKNPSYILLPGLGDQKPIFGWFYSWVEKQWRRAGMDARICQMKWVSDEPYERKLARLIAMIDEERTRGRGVVLVGVSAGAALGAVAFCKNSEGLALVSICGLLRLKPEDYKTSYGRTSWFKAAEAAEQGIKALSPMQKARVLTLSARTDNVIEPEREQIPEVTNIAMHARGHLVGIAIGFIWYRRQIARYIERLGNTSSV
jgi:hypothetical protein